MQPDVLKTYKLYIGGAFPRSESGRSYAPSRCDQVNAARASRKDFRNAVVAARKALDGWCGRDAYNRGQILYRLAEMLQSRHDALVGELRACGVPAAEARREVRQTIDLAVWSAGLADKIDVLLGSQNPVSGPFFSFSTVEPTGVVAVVAPESPSLLGLVAMLLPPLVGGNTVVALCSEGAPLPGVALAEACATADVPPGVVNLLTGYREELLPHVFSHRDVNAVFAAGPPDPELGAAAADAVTRVRWLARSAAKWRDPAMPRQLSWVEPFVEVKTLWHPVAP